MMYATLSLCFLGAALLVGVLLPLTMRSRRRPDVAAMAATLLALLILTAVFDNIMIGVGLFHYAPSQLLGIHVGLAPLEDFAYPLAGVMLLPALWAALQRRRPSRRPASPDEDEHEDRT